MICQNCGTQNPDTAKFCQNCGTNMSVQESSAQEQNPAPGYNPTQGYNSASGYNAVPGYPYPVKDEGKGFAIASLVLGILSFIIFGFIFGILAIIFGVVAKNKGSKSPLATAGIVVGAIGLSLMVIFAIIGFAAYMVAW